MRRWRDLGSDEAVLYARQPPLVEPHHQRPLVSVSFHNGLCCVQEIPVPRGQGWVCSTVATRDQSADYRELCPPRGTRNHPLQ